MNVKLVDGWTIIHFVSIFAVSLILLSRGTDIVFVVFTTGFIMLINEIIEHMFLFEFVKEIKEIYANSIMDIIAGIMGMVLAIIIV